VLRGRSGKYIRTEAANRLLSKARILHSSEPSYAGFFVASLLRMTGRAAPQNDSKREELPSSARLTSPLRDPGRLR
jgi:hypothetical protein